MYLQTYAHPVRFSKDGTIVKSPLEDIEFIGVNYSKEWSLEGSYFTIKTTKEEGLSFFSEIDLTPNPIIRCHETPP